MLSPCKDYTIMDSFTYKARLFKDSILGVLFCVVGGFLPSMTLEKKNLIGKTAIVTGANSGVGYGIALQLAEMGATVYLACRNEAKAAQSQADMLKTCPTATVKTLSLDTASFGSVKLFAKNWNHGPVDILAHNAGVSSVPKGRDFTEDGYEYQYQVNFLSSFLLTRLMEEHLTKDARVIFTSSIGSYFGRLSNGFAVTKTQMKIEKGFHMAPYDGDRSNRYAQTKLMQAAFARALQTHFDSTQESQRVAYSFHPGLVQSSILQDRFDSPFDLPVWVLGNLQPIFGLDMRQGSATGVHLATSDSSNVLQNKGRYFDRMWPRAHAVDVYPQEMLDRLWIRWTADCGITWLA